MSLAWDLSVGPCPSSLHMVPGTNASHMWRKQARVLERTLEETFKLCLKGTGQVKLTLQRVEIAQVQIGVRKGWEGWERHVTESACPDLQGCPEEARLPHHPERGEKGMKWEQSLGCRRRGRVSWQV